MTRDKMAPGPILQYMPCHCEEWRRRRRQYRCDQAMPRSEVGLARTIRCSSQSKAAGQLLEYAFWPGAPQVTRLVIVGETPIDSDGAEYLRRLKERFSLSLEFE